MFRDKKCSISRISFTTAQLQDRINNNYTIINKSCYTRCNKFVNVVITTISYGSNHDTSHSNDPLCAAQHTDRQTNLMCEFYKLLTNICVYLFFYWQSLHTPRVDQGRCKSFSIKCGKSRNVSAILHGSKSICWKSICTVDYTPFQIQPIELSFSGVSTKVTFTLCIFKRAKDCCY